MSKVESQDDVLIRADERARSEECIPEDPNAFPEVQPEDDELLIRAQMTGNREIARRIVAHEESDHLNQSNKLRMERMKSRLQI